MCRILSGCAVIGLLATNFRTRTEWVNADWAATSRGSSRFPVLGILSGHSDTYMTVFYLLAMAAALGFVLGWYPRLSGIMALLGFVLIVEQNSMVGDQGDNILRIGMTWLVLMHTGDAWTLRTWRPVAPLWLSNAVHNIALCALAAQIILIYVCAAAFKLKGPSWRDGTALFYPLELPEFRPFPGLSDLLVGNSIVLALVTWTAVLIQLVFPLLLLNRLTRRIGLALVVSLHLGIGIMMALPWFSLSMLAFDAIFVSTTTYVAFEAALRRSRSSFARR